MIKKLLRSKYSLFFLAIFIVLLYVILNKVVLPFIVSASDSSLFFESTQEEEQLGKVSNERTTFALMQCKNTMKEDGTLPENAQFPDDKYEAWALGNGLYIIRSSVTVADPEKGQIKKLFACKIQYKQGDISDTNSWSIIGIDFNPDAEGG
jgi:hypothetical protein